MLEIARKQAQRLDLKAGSYLWTDPANDRQLFKLFQYFVQSNESQGGTEIASKKSNREFEYVKVFMGAIIDGNEESFVSH
ncbi:MAG: hypothetical protein ACE5MK_04075 [Acidobacteriota bacterium]